MSSTKEDSALSVHLTLGVLGGGILLGLVVIFLVCAFCHFFNRRYANHHPKKSKSTTTLAAVTVQPPGTRPDKSPARMSTSASFTACHYCPQQHQPVQVVQNNQGGIQNCLLDKASTICSCGLIANSKSTNSSIDRQSLITGIIIPSVSVTQDQPQLTYSASLDGAVYGGEAGPIIHDKHLSVVTMPATPVIEAGAGDCDNNTHTEQMRPRPADISVKSMTFPHHPLLHPHFHSHSNDDLDEAGLGQAGVSPVRELQPLLQQPAGGELAPVAPKEMHLLEDPCKALWDLRSALENKTSPGDFEHILLSTCSDDAGQETLIRLITDSDLDEAGNPINRETRMPLSTSCMLTSLTSFESNTLSDESFDASTCAKALEAIFDEPSDLPARTSTSRAASNKYTTGTHLTPPVYRQQRKQSPPKLTSQQKRQSFKKAHHLATSHNSNKLAAEAISDQSQSAARANKPAPQEDLLKQQPEMAVQLAHVALSAEGEGIMQLPARSPSPHRLQQMRNDSGYKSQSFDTATTTMNAVNNTQHIHSYKSVPLLSQPSPSDEHNPGLDMLQVAKLIESGFKRENGLGIPNDGGALLSTSSELDDMYLSDCLDAIPSITSSMEIDYGNFGPSSIPLLRTLPATPTSPVPPRDWTIDEQSDRLFREFSRREGDRQRTRARSRPDSADTLRASPVMVSGVATPTRHRSGRSGKRKSYSPSSSHGGTPAQASIEETEEEQEGLTMHAATVCNTLPKDSDVSRSGELGIASALPDFFICSTREQLSTHMSMRSRSPELRHVPIIKLPDQESDEV